MWFGEGMKRDKFVLLGLIWELNSETLVYQFFFQSVYTKSMAGSIQAFAAINKSAL